MPTHAQQMKSLTYRSDVDGMRAIAILSVVAYHCNLPFTRGGFVGVDIFFVISGFLIGSLIYKEIGEHRFTLAVFYKRRAKRIVPALIGVLFFCYLAGVLMLSPHELRDFGRSAVAAVCSGSNILFWLRSGYFAADANLKPLLMTWTLGVEEQFYLICPLVLLLLRRVTRRSLLIIVAALSCVSLLLAIATATRDPDATFYLLPTRAWELATGIGVAVIDSRRVLSQSVMGHRMRKWVSAAGACLIGIAVFRTNIHTSLSIAAVTIPVAGAALIIWARDGIVNRFLAVKPLVFIGLVSYSWYLWHWPLLSFARICSDTDISQSVAVILAILSFGCAVLSWKFIERPFRESDTPAPVLLRRYAAFAALTAMPALVFWISAGLPQRNRVAEVMERGATPLREDPCLASYGRVPLNRSSFCDPRVDTPKVALLGDSHAADLAPAFRTLAARSGYALTEWTKSACPLLPSVTAASSMHPHHATECAQYNRERLRAVLGDRNIRIVVLSAVWGGYLNPNRNGWSLTPEGSDGAERSPDALSGLMSSGLDSVLNAMSEHHILVYLVQDNESFGFDPMRHMRTRLIAPRRLIAGIIAKDALQWDDGVAPSATSPESLAGRAIVAAAAERHPDVRIIDLRAKLCTPTGCRFAQGDEALFSDANHLTTLGASTAVSGVSLPAASSLSAHNQEHGASNL